MKLELPSGAWVSMRTELNAGDRSAMYEVTEIALDDQQRQDIASGKMRFSLGIVEAQKYAVLDRLIDDWSYAYTLPHRDDTKDPDTNMRLWQDSLRRLPLDDWDVIEEALDPLMDKLRNAGPKSSGTTTASSTGTSRTRTSSGSRKG